AIEWQIQNSRTLDHLANSGTPRLDQSSPGLNLDLLGYGSHFQHGVDDRIAADLQQNVALHETAKSAQHGFEPVWTESKIRKDIKPSLIRNNLADDSGFHLCRGNFDAR